jgi:hypothetical protein
MSFKIYLRSRGQESIVGPLVHKQGERIGHIVSLDVPAGESSFELIFRPDPQPAIESVEITNYWNEEIVLRNIQIKDNRPATQPTR